MSAARHSKEPLLPLGEWWLQQPKAHYSQPGYMKKNDAIKQQYVRERTKQAQRLCRVWFWSRTAAVLGLYVLCIAFLNAWFLESEEAIPLLLVLTGVPLLISMFVVEIYCCARDCSKALVLQGFVCTKCHKLLEKEPMLVDDAVAKMLERGACWHCGTKIFHDGTTSKERWEREQAQRSREIEWFRKR